MEYEEHTTTVEEIPANEPSTAAKVGVLIALIALLIVGILLPIKLVPDAFSTIGTKLSGIFKTTPKVALVSSTKNVTPGIPFSLSWTGDTHTDGTYVFTYDCSQNVQLETSINQPHEHIQCGNPYYFAAGTTTLPLTAFSEATSTVTMPVSLSYIQNGAKSPAKIADTTLTVEAVNTPINPNDQGIITVKPKPTTKPSSSTHSSSTTTTPVVSYSTPTSTPPTAFTIANLTVHIVSVGYIDPTTGGFVESRTIPSGMRGAVRFNIRNTGTKSTGSWAFVAALPSLSHPTYTSPVQNSLAQGNGVIYTLSFDDVRPGTSIIRITADPSHRVVESSTADNTASFTIYSN